MQEWNITHQEHHTNVYSPTTPKVASSLTPHDVFRNTEHVNSQSTSLFHNTNSQSTYIHSPRLNTHNVKYDQNSYDVNVSYYHHNPGHTIQHSNSAAPGCIMNHSGHIPQSIMLPPPISSAEFYTSFFSGLDTHANIHASNNDSNNSLNSNNNTLVNISPNSNSSPSSPPSTSMFAFSSSSHPSSPSSSSSEREETSSDVYYQSDHGEIPIATATTPTKRRRIQANTLKTGPAIVKKSRSFNKSDQSTLEVARKLSEIPGLEAIRWESLLNSSRKQEVPDNEVAERVYEAEVLGSRLFGGDLEKLLASLLSQHLDFLVFYVRMSLSGVSKRHKRIRDSLFQILSSLKAKESEGDGSSD